LPVTSATLVAAISTTGEMNRGRRGAVRRGADDFSMLWLLFRAFLPQMGGLGLMLAKTNS
jgi:hypothetical protein